MQGKAIIQFVILPTGKVTGASVDSSSLGDAKTEQCLVNRVLTMKFPSFQGKPQTVNFPFVVSK
jgi:TonB family protein